jgi:hypothetical protein
MARPTAGNLTGAGYSLVTGSTTKYAKAAGTATVACDLAAGTANTGAVSLAPTTAGTPIAAADLATAQTTLGKDCLQNQPTNSMHSAGLVYYGITA